MKKIKILLLYIAKYTFAFRLARYLTRNYPRILCYHGGCLSDENKFNSLLFMRKDLFTKRIDWLISEKFNFSNLDDLDRKISNSVIITFDDGWYSTYSELIPVLIEKKIPSTIYLSTFYYERQTPILPVVISYISWRATVSIINLNDIDKSLNGCYNLKDKVSVQQIINLIEEHVYKLENGDDVGVFLNRLSIISGVNPAELGLDSKRFSFMDQSEILSIMGNHCKLELHGHKHEYPIGLPEQFEQDLSKCSDVLLKYFHVNGKHYCYPSGTYDDDAASILSKKNIKTATTCIPGLVVDFEKQKHYLPRFLDGENITDIEFEAELMGFNYYLRKALR